MQRNLLLALVLSGIVSVSFAVTTPAVNSASKKIYTPAALTNHADNKASAHARKTHRSNAKQGGSKQHEADQDEKAKTTKKPLIRRTSAHVTHHSTHSGSRINHPHNAATSVKSVVAVADTDDNAPITTHLNDTTTHSWFSSAEKRLSDFAYQTVNTLHYSSYKYGGRRFDPQNGIYQVDCSRYVDNLLNQANPHAFYTLAHWSGSESPTSEHYYQFFNRLSNDSGNQWRKVESGENLQAGDILVFRYLSSHGHSAGGHVMVVVNKSTPLRGDIVAVRVADSASAGHSEDTRGYRKSGVGIGTLLLKVNPRTGQPLAFAWRADAPWRQNVAIAMGRPADKGTA